MTSAPTPAPEALVRAADALRESTALVIAAGAGMGVDSGLPDFRGDQGFWNAYPPYAKLGLSFADLANPAWFTRDPGLAWGFYGHRLALYRATKPHAGFAILDRWASARPHGGFVFTSNVDGQFQRAGFAEARIVECHGALDWLQCTRACGVGLLRADRFHPAVDEATFRAVGVLPACPKCGGLLRPNVLMFGDYGWDDAREQAQARRFEAWLSALGDARLVVVECGAGTGVPTVRATCERLARTRGATLVRINVREPAVPPGHVGVPMGALAALTALDAAL